MEILYQLKVVTCVFYILDNLIDNIYTILDTEDSSIEQVTTEEVGEYILQGLEINGVSYSKNGDLKIVPLSVSYPCLEPVENEETGRTYLKYCINDVGTFIREMKSMYLSKEAIRENAEKYGFDVSYVMKYFK